MKTRKRGPRVVGPRGDCVFYARVDAATKDRLEAYLESGCPEVGSLGVCAPVEKEDNSWDYRVLKEKYDAAVKRITELENMYA